jgi:hypothetical protein
MWGAVLLLLVIVPSSIWGYLAVGLGTALVGAVGGAIVGFGQVLALRRWLDGAASVGSFFSTILASSSALVAGTIAAWWVHTSAGDLPGVVTAVVLYGCVFGLIQRPMLDYMAKRSILWIPANALAGVLGAATVLAAFDVSGGRRDMLQFRYAGVAYSLVVGAAFLLMTREIRRAMANERIGQEGREVREDDRSDTSQGPAYEVRNTGSDPALLEVHEHRIYRVYRPSQASDLGRDSNAHSPGSLTGRGDLGPEDGDNGPVVIDADFRVIS